MAPESETDFEIAVEGNGFEGTMTAQAAGITAMPLCLQSPVLPPRMRASPATSTCCVTSRSSTPEAGAILAAID
jgi:hypothetical protein